ncbi:MAG: glycosyltransferase [Candidatus Shapirobacteria bacterium]|jgi:GT2 family glycosyltransferase
MKISVIVTNWNGLNLLNKNFINVIQSSPEAEEIILADDASEDGSVKYIKSLRPKYPQIKLITNSVNMGFGKNTNRAVSQAKGELVVLLNSDITPEKNYIKNALLHFKNPKVYGVGFSERGNENWAKIYWKEGYIQYEPGREIDKTHITGWLSGGGCILRKDIFIKLGGFDEIYAPFYSEDLDIGYRAWKSGYILLWEPKCIIRHKHESTMSKFPKRFSDYVKERNRLLTVLRNITDPQMIRQNKLTQILRVLSGPNYLKIIRAAKRQIGKFPSQIVFPKLTDKEIFDLFK